MDIRIGMLGGTLLSLLLAGAAQAELISRLDGQAIYDTDLDITWIADANLAASNTFGIDPSYANGFLNAQLSWNAANNWIAAMNAANYLGYSDWRLPTTLQPDPSCDTHSPYGYGSSGYGCMGGELGHLYHSELGGAAGQSIYMTHNENHDLFSNIQGFFYWTGTTCMPRPHRRGISILLMEIKTITPTPLA